MSSMLTRLREAVWPGQHEASVTWDPLDDRWYTSDLGMSSGGGDAGVYVSAETMFRCAWVFAAIRFLSTSVAMCTPQVFKELPGNKRTEDRGYPLHRVLRRPNAWMTGYRWRAQNMVWVTTWGNSYNRIRGGAGQVAGTLEALHPSRVKIKRQDSSGYLYYAIKTGEREEIVGQDEMLHFRGLSLDGIEGAAMYQLIRNVVAIALAAEKHIGTLMKKGSRLSGLLVPKTNLDQEKRTLLAKNWNESFGGSDATGTYGVAPFEVDVKPIASTNRETQIVELRDQQVQEILGFLGVPGAVVGYTGNMTSTLPAMDAFYEKGGVKFAIQPWVENFEEEIEWTLIPEGDPHFVKMNMDVLLRSDFKTRIETLVKATGRPFLTGNEARLIEDYDPAPQADMDEVAGQQGGGMTPGLDEPPAAPPAAPPRRTPAAADPAEMARAERLRQIELDTAARVVRREIAWAKDRAPQMARKPEAWREAVMAYYEKHEPFVAEAMRIPVASAKKYAESQRDALLAGGVGILEKWEAEVPHELAALAYGE